MNYKVIYDNIINRAKNRTITGYVEKHHIIPRSLGGTNSKKNIVILTAREHFLCHYMLIHIYKNSAEYYKMLNAFMMTDQTHLLIF